jgi:hypothetical protein
MTGYMIRASVACLKHGHMEQREIDEELIWDKLCFVGDSGGGYS